MYDQLGFGYTGPTGVYVFQAVGSRFVDNGNAVDVECGSNHRVVLTNGCKVYTCGQNRLGRLGLGDNDLRSEITFSNQAIEKISEIRDSGTRAYEYIMRAWEHGSS